MTTYPRIRRFRRTPSDAFLVPPPDTRAYCAETTVDREEATNFLRSEFPGAVLFRSDFASMSRALVQLEAAEEVSVYQDNGGFDVTFRITRRAPISKKVLDRLTPLQRQRMHKPVKP